MNDGAFNKHIDELIQYVSKNNNNTTQQNKAPQSSPPNNTITV